MTDPHQLSVQPDLEERPRRRRTGWVAKCADCNRRIWAESSLRRRFGRHLGGGCYRKRVRASRRLVISQTFTVRPPGHIPGQIAITDLDQEE
ncbi:hypothetical protein [Streptosporangium longisporum]|uniref:BED-type domain-containing protein n=1 Tax=Streptosporangium longisporum TaxID=46187 RepID=A0ABN1YRQ9_9ACTN